MGLFVTQPHNTMGSVLAQSDLGLWTSGANTADKEKEIMFSSDILARNWSGAGQFCVQSEPQLK